MSRRQRIPVNFTELARILRGESAIADWPQDARIVDVILDPRYFNTVDLLVESDSFLPTNEGCEICRARPDVRNLAFWAFQFT